MGIRLAMLAAAALLMVASCSAAPGQGAAAQGAAGQAAPATTRADYDANLWAQRPVVELAFDMASDLSSVAGHETVTFTPDLRACELVFRAWPNNPTMAKTGASLIVTGAAVSVTGADRQTVNPDVQAAGAPAGSPGTLIQLTLPRCLEPGQSVTADLDFTLRLGADADERVGYSPKTETAWFGSGFPLLSWVRGQGWTRDPAVPMNGETATSEVFALKSLSVTAPSDYQVAGAGEAGGTVAGRTQGTTTHRFSAGALRDVTVGVGRYDLAESTVGDVRLHVATPTSGTRVDPAEWTSRMSSAVSTLAKTYGPFPYPDLWITITPGQSDGSEFPGAVQFGDVSAKQLPALGVHEIAHQWFYSLVGNNQARNPWLDESLAAFSEGVALGRKANYSAADVSRRVKGRMGEPMSYWAANGGFDDYDQGVYNQGAAILADARTQVGQPAFDADLRSYLAANAHRVVTPDDFARAFADQPKVLDMLRQAGALPQSG